MPPKITLLATGGTIASLQTPSGLAPAMRAEDLLSACPKLRGLCDITAIDVFSLDSSNIQPEEWQILAQAIRETLGPVADSACNISVKKGDKDFSAAVTQIKGAAPDAIFYSGYYAEAATFAQQLKDGGVTATFASADGTKDPEFVKQGGEATKGAILSCPCGPASKQFAEEYTKKFGQEPGTYSTEGYDLGTIMLKGIDSGAITRPALLDFVKNYNGQGVARNYQWSPTGELTTNLIWIFKVQ